MNLKLIFNILVKKKLIAIPRLNSHRNVLFKKILPGLS